MPLVQVQHLAGAFTEEQQKVLIADITNAFVRASGEGIRKNVLVTISEVASGLWATGGIPLTIDEVRKRQAEREAGGA